MPLRASSASCACSTASPLRLDSTPSAWCSSLCLLLLAPAPCTLLAADARARHQLARPAPFVSRDAGCASLAPFGTALPQLRPCNAAHFVRPCQTESLALATPLPRPYRPAAAAAVLGHCHQHRNRLQIVRPEGCISRSATTLHVACFSSRPGSLAVGPDGPSNTGDKLRGGGPGSLPAGPRSGTLPRSSGCRCEPRQLHRLVRRLCYSRPCIRSLNRTHDTSHWSDGR